MVIRRKTFLTWWVLGLIVFAIVIVISLPLGITAVPGGILDHQAAGTAANVDAIQSAWAKAGLMGTARIAIIGDLIFIGIYGIGAVLGGLYFRSVGANIGSALLRISGMVIAICGAVFLAADYAETIAQLMQVLANQGSDELAGFAAMLRPIKSFAFTITFVGILAALLTERILHRRA